MRVSVAIDIAKEVHWITAIDECGEIRLDHRLDNGPTAIEVLIGELRALERRHHRRPRRGRRHRRPHLVPCAEAMLALAGWRLVHVPGLAVNRRARAPLAARARAIRETPA